MRISAVRIYLFIIFVVLSLGSTVSAVDGYKDLKFGISAKELLERDLCMMRKFPSENSGVENYGCEDFRFGGKRVNAVAFFIDDKLLRFGIATPTDMAEVLATQLVEKYGSPSSISTTNEFDAVDTLPNRVAFIAFDDDTVIFKVSSDENNNQITYLIYTSPSFDGLVLKLQQDLLKDDL